MKKHDKVRTYPPRADFRELNEVGSMLAKLPKTLLFLVYGMLLGVISGAYTDEVRRETGESATKQPEIWIGGECMFGDRLRKARLEAGLTQEELGGRAGCSDSMVAQMEKGTKTPGIALLASLTKTLGCSADELLHGICE